MKRLKFFMALLIFGSSNLHAQHGHEELNDSLRKSCRIESLNDIFTKGTWGGHVRNYFMFTDHIGDYKTQYADAIGMKVHYTTAEYRGLSIALGGIFSFDLFSSDLAELDPRSGRHPAFELQLFDIENPENKYDLDRLEELYLKYAFGKKSSILIGRHQIFTPFVNPADGRMKPYAFQGVTFDFREFKATRIYGSYISHVSPRSTVEWHRIEDSIGKYSEGYDPKGDPAEYEHYIESNGLLIFGLDRQFGKELGLSATYYYADNVLSTLYLKADYRKSIGQNFELVTGIEGMVQSRLGNGGSDSEDHTYMCDQDENHGIGYTLGGKYKSVDFSFSGLKLGNEGRFLFPREWGRENFYATIPRGRVEGMGDAHLYRFHLGKKFKSGLLTGIDYTFLDGPGTNSVDLNKYRIPNYNQVNIDLGYEFHGWMKGTSLHVLYVYKEATEEVDPEVEYYQANFNHFNLVMNVLF
jgi:hypothetical protein